MMTRNITNVVQRDGDPPSVGRSIVHGEFDEQNGMRIMIDTIREDVKDIEAFYNVNFSRRRSSRLTAYLNQKLVELGEIPFDRLGQEARTDFVLLQKYLQRQLQGFESFNEELVKMAPIIEPFTTALVELIERRQAVVATSGEYAAGVLSKTCTQIRTRHTSILKDGLQSQDKEKRFIAYQAAKVIDELHLHLVEWDKFYNSHDSYDPLFTFWTSAPFKSISKQLIEFSAVVRERLVGITPGDDDAIVGQPIGRKGILAALKSAVIAYTPEELVEIAERQYAWCEEEMVAASKDLGYGEQWRDALEHVKTMYPQVGQQPQVVHELANEAIQYVKKHDMITIPQVAEENWRTYMMSPKRQKVAPFFLGGSSILVSYPTGDMSYEEKLMTLRGNSRPFSRAVVFHELIPGHHLQYHMNNRYRKYRSLFGTPFWMEGWALYWEMILWDRKFVDTPENKIGM